MCSGIEGHCARAVRGGLLEHGGDRVGRQFGGLSVVRAVEQRPCRGEFRGVRVELGEVDAQMVDGLLGERHDAGLVPFAGEGDVAGIGQGEVSQREAGDLTHACGGVIEQDEQHPVSAGLRRLPGERGKDRPCFGFVEVLDGRPGVSWGLECLGGLAERDEGEVFAGCVGQERLDGAQAQRDGLGRVVPLIGHPGHPSFQVLADRSGRS